LKENAKIEDNRAKFY